MDSSPFGAHYGHIVTRSTLHCMHAYSHTHIANGSRGFDSRLIDLSPPEASEVARRREIDNLVDQLDEVELPVHVSEAPNQTDFDASIPKTLFEMEEDLDKLLEITKDPVSGCQQDIVQIELPVNMASTKTIENYLKDRPAIPCPRVVNSDLLDGIDRVSESITDCINLAESALRKKKMKH